MTWVTWPMPLFSITGSWERTSISSIAQTMPAPLADRTNAACRACDYSEALEQKFLRQPELPYGASEGPVNKWWLALMRQHVLPPKLLKGGLSAWVESPRWSHKHQLPTLPWVSGQHVMRSAHSGQSLCGLGASNMGSEHVWRYLQCYGQAIAEAELAQLGRTPFYWSALRCSEDLRQVLQEASCHFSLTQHCSFAPLYLYCRELICLQFWKEQLCRDFDALPRANLRCLDKQAQLQMGKLDLAFRTFIRSYQGYMEQSLRHLTQMAFGLLRKKYRPDTGQRQQFPQDRLRHLLATSNAYIKHSLIGAELFRRAHHWLVHATLLSSPWHHDLTAE